MQSESGYHFMAEYLTCQQKFYWNYIEGIIPKQVSKHLLFGDAIHKSLAKYYSETNTDSEERSDTAIGVFCRSMKDVQGDYTYQEDYEKDLKRGVFLLGEYFLTRDFLSQTVPDGVEVHKELTLPSGRVLTGNIDLISGSPMEPVIYDHKTTGWAIPLVLQSLRMSNQATTYLALCPNASAMIYNILYQKGDKCAFHREIVYRTKSEIDNWITQADEVLGEISSKVGQPQNKWWRNSNSCFSYNHICEYVDLCKGGSTALSMGQFKYREKEL